VETHNKLVLAADMFVEAHNRFVAASRAVDYVSSLMLAGAVEGIVAPLLIEQGGRSSHQLLAALSDIVREPGEPPTREGVFRTVYNGLKHAGDRRRDVAPSADLDLVADLRAEAAEMLEAAREDFRKVVVSSDVRVKLAPQFIGLLASTDDYA
jgi:hypothetical protein